MVDGQVARELLRRAQISTPGLRRPAHPATQFQKGWGISFGAHGLGASYKDWLKAFGSPEIDALHESLNIQYSVCGPVNGKVSTDPRGRRWRPHVHKSFKDTAKFDATFQDVKAQITKDGVYKEPSRFVYGEVMNTPTTSRPGPSSTSRPDTSVRSSEVLTLFGPCPSVLAPPADAPTTDSSSREQARPRDTPAPPPASKPDPAFRYHIRNHRRRSRRAEK